MSATPSPLRRAALHVFFSALPASASPSYTTAAVASSAIYFKSVLNSDRARQGYTSSRSNAQCTKRAPTTLTRCGSAKFAHITSSITGLCAPRAAVKLSATQEFHRLQSPRWCVSIACCAQALSPSSTSSSSFCSSSPTASVSASSSSPSSSSSSSSSFTFSLSPAHLGELDRLAARLITGDRAALSRSITLVESSLHLHKQMANYLLQEATRLQMEKKQQNQKEQQQQPQQQQQQHTLPYTPHTIHPIAASSLPASSASFSSASSSPPPPLSPSPSPSPSPHSTLRLGISGPPGAGKSTFIESLGRYLLSHHSPNTSIAVLSIDPSSHLTGGSILGDKTRMPFLSSHPRAYIRPSASKGGLGGTHRNTYEAVRLCELAGYEIIIVETVGVGQSEIHVRMLVDVLLLLVSPTGGDELQGMKKGIVEVADVVVVNKAGGERDVAGGIGEVAAAANATKADYQAALQLLHMIRGSNNTSHSQSSHTSSSSSSPSPHRELPEHEREHWMPVVELCSSLEPTYATDVPTQRQQLYSSAATEAQAQERRAERKAIKEKQAVTSTAANTSASSSSPSPASSTPATSLASSISSPTACSSPPSPSSRPPSVATIWSIIERWRRWSFHSNRLFRLRSQQLEANFWNMVADEAVSRVKYGRERGETEEEGGRVRQEVKVVERELREGKVMPRVAAQRVIDTLMASTAPHPRATNAPSTSDTATPATADT